MKIIPLLMPVSETLITSDTPDEERGQRVKLSKDALALSDALLANHPEVKILMALFYTPPEVKGTRGSFDWNHTMLASQDGVTTDHVREFLDMAIPAMLKLRISIDEDPALIAAMRAKQ